jgi:hypothetical protein
MWHLTGDGSSDGLKGDIGGSYFNRKDRHLEQQWH